MRKIWVIALIAVASCSNKQSELDSLLKSITPVPELEPCQRKYVSVKKDTFEKCLLDGMTHSQVAQIIGWDGTLGSQSGDQQVWQWGDGNGGYITVGFIGERLVSKSQTGLE